MSEDTSLKPEQATQSTDFIPDLYYFPTQVVFELDNIQNNVLGKVLTLIETLGLDQKREKAIKDLIRTVIKEQIIKSGNALDSRLDTVLELGIQDNGMRQSFRFTNAYKVTPIYSEEDMTEPMPK